MLLKIAEWPQKQAIANVAVAVVATLSIICRQWCTRVCSWMNFSVLMLNLCACQFEWKFSSKGLLGDMVALLAVLFLSAFVVALLFAVLFLSAFVAHSTFSFDRAPRFPRPAYQIFWDRVRRGRCCQICCVLFTEYVCVCVWLVFSDSAKTVHAEHVVVRFGFQCG